MSDMDKLMLIPVVIMFLYWGVGYLNRKEAKEDKAKAAHNNDVGILTAKLDQYYDVMPRDELIRKLIIEGHNKIYVEKFYSWYVSRAGRMPNTKTRK